MDTIAFIMKFKFQNEVWMIVIPVVMMGMDYLSGTIYALSSQTFRSRKMRAGLTKKIGELMILILGEVFSYGLSIPAWIMSGISAYIIFMEFMSVMENFKKMGVPIPGFISKALRTVDAAIKEDDVAEALKKMADIEKEIKALKSIEQKE